MDYAGSHNHSQPPGGLQHIVTTGMAGLDAPTPTSATYTDSPGQDYYSPASTSYLPTPPLVPSHAHGLLPHLPIAGPSRTSPQRSDGSPNAYTRDAFLSRRSSDAYPESRRGSEPMYEDGRVGVEDPYAERKYTELKVLGDGSFGTVWLCDWHSPVKPHVLLSAMQCGAGARPEWTGKRLVALKRMKRVWEGGWSQARNLGELVSLRSIPPHPAVIPLYDAFISPRSRELYFVFECMEGNLYQLTKSRKGRPLAAGLIASCFHQIVGGLNHIHNHGYFHRDMKPENLLVTTTGLCDYLSSSALAEINARRESGLSDDIQLTNDRIEKDVQVIVKLADFGLARAIASKPPYTEYVSTRWYRAPEVLLRSTEYGAPVDMWALGTILAEMVNLKPLFPGVSEIDQVYRICDTLGDPSEHGFDDRGKIVGGGRWSSGVKLAKNVGFSFPKRQPANFRALFPKDTPDSLIDCIADLLRYDPKYRLNSAQCLEHPYYMETLPHLQHVQPLPHISFVRGQPPSPQRQSPSSVGERSRQSTPTHMPYPQEARPYLSELRIPVGMPIEVHTPESMHSAGPPMVYARPPMLRQDSEPQSASTLVHLLRALDLPTDDLASYGQRGPAPADELAINASRRPSLAVSHHEGSAYQGSVHSSHPGYGPVHPAVSSNNVSPTLPSPVQTTNPHVAAYVLQQQQQAFERQSMRQVSQSTPTLPNSMVNEVTPRVSSHSTMTLPMLSIPPTYHSPVPSPTQVMSPKPMMPGKKKKWGLSSVFGGGDKHDSPTSLSAVDERELSSSAGLKRTQSGHYAGERSIAAPAALDPKQSKKLAEREKRELQKAKREAAERAQQERARAVLQKRSQLVGNHAGATEFEYNDAGMAMPMASLRSPLGAPKSNQSPISLASPRTHGVHPYGLDTYAADGGRNKARKTAEDDDHSSIGRTSSHSRSLLSVGTVDSDPGPRRGQQGWMDPMVQNSRRTPSHAAQNRLPGGPRSTSSLMTHSTISLESQLASQIARHASGQSASESSLSVGHRAGHSLNVQMPMPAPQAGASAPTSPYGQPGVAGYPGHGVHRSGKLPSINDWAGSSDINPMFKVPHQEQQHPSEQTTLPPFSTIANIADSQSPTHHRHQ